MASTMRSSLMRQACMSSNLAARGATTSSAFAAPRFAPQLTRALQKPSFVQNGGMRVAAFHASSRNQILPPLPQNVEGTANDAVRVPTPSPSHGSYHWSFERAVSLALIPVTIAPFAAGVPYPIVDATLCALLMLHSHIGFQAIVIDYIPKKRMPRIRSLFDYGTYLATGVVAFGLYEFETNDVGLTEAVARIWKA